MAFTAARNTLLFLDATLHRVMEGAADPPPDHASAVAANSPHVRVSGSRDQLLEFFDEEVHSLPQEQWEEVEGMRAQYLVCIS